MPGLTDRIWSALATVRDPEIPPCSITDLGIVEDVRVSPDAVEVDLLPTFAGCPALDVIREDAEAAIRAAAEANAEAESDTEIEADAGARAREVRVRFVYSKPWTSDRITLAGRAALESYGVTPPSHLEHAGPAFIPLASLERVEGTIACPFCGSQSTVLESAFGPTLCRSTHFCQSCRNPFEAFKPKGVAAPAPRPGS